MWFSPDASPAALPLGLVRFALAIRKAAFANQIICAGLGVNSLGVGAAARLDFWHR